jgi:hypothetical protein
MARKTTGNTTTRSKKNVGTIQPVSVQVAPEVPKVSKSTNPAPATANIEEQIRVRAYELYLQRRATAGSANGNPNQDWLIAEREVLSRHSDPDHHSA